MNSANSVPIDLNYQSISQIPIPTTTTTTTTATISDQAQTKIDSSASSSVPNYGYYVDPNSQYYQQYYQQYYAYAQSMSTSYDQSQSSTIPSQPYYYPPVTNETQTVPGTAYHNTAYLATQASYLPTLLAATSSKDGSTSGNVPNNYQDHDGDYDDNNDDDDDDDDPTIAKPNQPKLSNILNYRCNEKMGLNPLIYTNIQQSPYFKTNLFQLKTFNEVIDEIFYSVKHLEPWEKGSRKNSGQTGMCGSVRGVGAGGIISTPFCILYKLFTLRLTRKQVLAMIRHKDSPYIRALGFMYIRFTQPSQDLWKWFEPYLKDDETVDPKAGGGSPMTIGEMVRHFLTKLDWFATLFPRIPRQVQLEIEKKLKNYDQKEGYSHDNGDNNDGYRKKSINENSDHEDHKNKHHHHNHANNKNGGRPKRSRSRSGSPCSSKHRLKKYDDHFRKTGNNYNNSKNFRYS